MSRRNVDGAPLLCRIFGHRMHEEIYPYGCLPAPVCGRRKCNHTKPGQEWRVAGDAFSGDIHEELSEMSHWRTLERALLTVLDRDNP